MKEEIDLTLFPVTNCFVGPLAQENSVVIRLDFLAHSMQDDLHPSKGRNYVLSAREAMRLASEIASAVQELSSQTPSAGGHQQH